MGIFGSSGVRQKATGELLLLLARMGVTLGASATPVVVGRDTRTSGLALQHAFTSGLLLAGCRPYDAGVVPTPVLARAARHFAAGAMITASHNPPEDNGLKLWNPDGSAFGAEQRRNLEKGLQVWPELSWRSMSESQGSSPAVPYYLEDLQKDLPTGLGVRVVVDTGGGAASEVTPVLLKNMGCEVVTLHSSPTGVFPRPSEPTAENLRDLTRAVRAFRAHLGIAHDADGDRVAVTDEKGRFIGGDRLTVLLAQDMKARRLVTTVDASMLLEEMGWDVVRTRVGDAYVSEAMKDGGDLGAEPSGCFIFPRFSFCPDGVHAAARFAMMASRAPLSQVVDKIPSYPILRGHLSGSNPDLEGLRAHMDDLPATSWGATDGLRLSFPDAWLLVRASGTEPKTRITVEARSPQRARELYAQARVRVSRWLEHPRA